MAVVSDADSSPESMPPARRRKREPGTYFAVVAEAYIVADVKPPQLRLWTWLDWKAGTSGVAMASYPEMAEALGMSESSVERHVRALLARRWLTLIRPGKGHGRAHYGVVNHATTGVSEGSRAGVCRRGRARGARAGRRRGHVPR